MSSSTLFVVALVFALGHVQCQLNRVRPGPRPPQIADGCQGKVMDIFFVMDSSTSIYINDYRQEQQFVRDVVNRLDVSQSATRVGFLTFSDDIRRPTLDLSRFRSRGEAIASINDDNLPYTTGITNTHLALRYVRQNQEFREDITKVIVVITDGESRSPASTANEAALARENGFYLFVIGIGTYLDEREWRSIASDPDDSFIYNITSFRFLESVRFSLPPRACELPPIIVRGSCQVRSTTDLYFVAAPGGVNDAFEYIDYFEERTTDPQSRLRISYVMDACENAYNVRLGEFSNYCDRFAPRGETTRDTYSNLLYQLSQRIRASNEEASRFAYQAAVLFVDEEAMRANSFAIISEARNLEQTLNVKIAVIDLRARSFSDNLDRISANVEVVRTGAGTTRQNRNAFLDATCRAITRRRLPDIGEN